jgi:hypothetical protein
VINLVVSVLDKQGKFELGDRIDRGCRWWFPGAYFGLLAVMVAVAILLLAWTYAALFMCDVR